jgi:hypothetical protein
MTMLWLLLSSCALAAAPPSPAPWVNTFEIAVEGKPRAAYFDAGTSSLLVALDNGAEARVDRYSLEGKLQEKGVMTGAGEAGALRAYDVRLFWLAGGKLLASGPHGRALPVSEKFAGGGFADVTVLRGGKPLAVGAAGVTTEEKVDPFFKGATGVYQFLNDVYVLFGGRLGKLGETKSEKVCGDCHWLERTSAGDWLFVEGKKVIRRAADKKNRTFLELSSAPGRPAYVFQKDPADDFLVVPLPEEGKVRAFRAPRAPQKPI